MGLGLVMKSSFPILRQLSERSEVVRPQRALKSLGKELFIKRDRPRMGSSKLVGGRFRTVGNLFSGFFLEDNTPLYGNFL